uniref:Uncharacterized protein n=1 Tax=Cynoglossus semilaevis TaxID=244447 RepID=A0A3P8V9E0_CYNSE
MKDSGNFGALSLTSDTRMETTLVPDFGGLPPSTAVSVIVTTGCFSRSTAFCSTNSADTPIGILPSFPLSLTSKRKWSLLLSLYCCTEK